MREIDDMGITPVENSFLNHYMSKARGDYVKVYLYGLKCCFQGSSEFPSNSEIADFLMIEEDLSLIHIFISHVGSCCLKRRLGGC